MHTRRTQDEQSATRRVRSGRRRVGAVATAAAAALVVASVALPVSRPAQAQTGGLGATQSFHYTGGPQQYTVPANVKALTFTVIGGAGQVRHHAGHPGGGAMTLTAFPVTPGKTLTIWVGGAGVAGGGWGFGCGGEHGNGGPGTGGAPGNPGSGGGGASAVTRGTTSLAAGDCASPRPGESDILTVAGGGGGGGGSGAKWIGFPNFHYIQGASTEGGDGGAPPSAGQPNQNPDSAGCGGCESTPNGTGGEDHAVLQPSSGGGGGGGGGFNGGGGGHGSSVEGNASANGAGGGGGLSYIAAGARVALHEPGGGTGPGSVHVTLGDLDVFSCTHNDPNGSVPTDAGAAVITAQGGSGASAENVGVPGTGAVVEATYPVDENWTYHLGVGCVGDYREPGFGLSPGGEGGHADGSGALSGTGGGGATGVILSGPAGASHTVVAGGGGGAGGKAVPKPGDGGNGGSPPGAGTEGHGQPKSAPGGCGGCHGSSGPLTAGVSGHHSPSVDDGGGGGGGGSGHFAGGGGDGGTFVDGSGGGGGAGSSWYTDGATNASVSTAQAQGNGYLEIVWLPRTAAAVSAVSGSKQSARVGETFDQRLVAKVMDANGDPMPGAVVEFELPTAPVFGTFGGTGGSTIATETTGEDGTATSPPIVAADEAGSWAATLAVEGTDLTTSFSLENDPDPSSVALTLDPTTVTRTQLNSVIATVTGTTGGPAPTGTVYFDVQGTKQAVGLDPSGVAELQLPAGTLTLGSSLVTATYGGDDHYGLAGSSTKLDVVATPTSIALRGEPNPAVGEQVVFSAALDVAAGNTTCVGCTITFSADGAALGSGTVDSSGVATFGPVDTLALGAHTIEASFAASSPWAPSHASMTQHIESGDASVTIDAPDQPTQWGAALDLAAHVTVPSGDPAPTGQVTFAVGSTSACVATLDGTGAGTCTVAAPDTTAWTPGSHQVTATYGGDTTYGPSTTSISHTITPAATSATLVASSPLVTSGDPVTFDVQIARTDPGADTGATGSVTLYDDGVPIPGLEGLAITGGALTTPAVVIEPDGIHTIRVEYTPSAASPYESASATTPLTVHPAISATTVTTSVAGSSDLALQGNSLEGQSVTVATAVTGGGPTPDGLVQFLVDGFARGPMVPLVDGHASSPPIEGLAAGTHRVAVRFLPGPGYTASVAIGQHLVSQPTDVIVASALFDTTSSGPLFAAHVGPEAPGGTLTFAVDGVPLEACTALPVDDSETDCTAAAVPFDARTVTVSYSGTPGFEPSQTTLAIPSGATVLPAAPRASAATPIPAAPDFTG